MRRARRQIVYQQIGARPWGRLSHALGAPFAFHFGPGQGVKILLS